MPLDLHKFASHCLVTDGAWGTELHKLGLSGGAAAEFWNIKNRDAVASVADSYVRAGSDVILTNTFGANKFVMATHGAADMVEELAEAGVEISRKAADSAWNNGREVKVFASIGPSGRIVMMDQAAEEELAQAFAQTAKAVASAGADAIVLESFAELEELRIALQAVKATVSLPVVVSMTFSCGPDKTCTMMGNKPSELAAMAKRFKADAVGANCGVGPDNYVTVAKMLRQACDLPIWIKANAGLPVLGPDRKTTFPMNPADFAAFAPKLVKAGANFIGGCCGTTPEHIQALRAEMNKRK
jgi:methionine synthase I (cobalamin-dependent)